MQKTLKQFLKKSVLIDELLRWFDKNQRELPWRKTKDPYAIWVSEIMLQQTQVSTVIPYWIRWMERFPTTEELARSSETEVLTFWQGLGYYSRGRNLLKGAQFVQDFGLPASSQDWLKVPGIGRYTAGAIASIAQNEQVPLVDGNVARVFSRLEAFDDSFDKTLNAAWVWAEKMVPKDRPGDWNQSLMELGATICTPKAPKCEKCPIQQFCRANELHLQNQLPRPKAKPETIVVFENRLISVSDNMIGLQQAKPDDWWQGMFLLPKTEPHEFLAIGQINHVVTHHKIRLSLFFSQNKHDDLVYVSISDLQTIPIPTPHRKAIQLVIQST